MTYLFNCSAIYKCKDSYDFVGGDMPIGSAMPIGSIVPVAGIVPHFTHNSNTSQLLLLQSGLVP